MSKFLDRLRIFVRSGSGAPGNPFVRGKGGDGGNVYLKVNHNQSLKNLVDKFPNKRFTAQNGLEASKRSGLTIGVDGKDLIIPVPQGVTVLFGGQGNSQTLAGWKLEENKVIGQLDEREQMLMVAKGGLGGTPNSDYLGTPGQAHTIVLDLKLMSDFALIGFPNAGKSSLLKALSGAQAKIASYPFTTVRPQLAHCCYADQRRISLTDLPGLSDIYAHYGSVNDDELGGINNDAAAAAILPKLRHTNFLKHVERSSAIAMVLDATGFRRDQHSSNRSPLAVAYLIVHLLERWSHGVLLDKPFVCILNKIDLPGALDNAKETKYWLERMHTTEAKTKSGLAPILIPQYTPQFKAIELVSATCGTNISELKRRQRIWLDEIMLAKRGDDEVEETNLVMNSVLKNN